MSAPIKEGPGLGDKYPGNRTFGLKQIHHQITGSFNPEKGGGEQIWTINEILSVAFTQFCSFCGYIRLIGHTSNIVVRVTTFFLGYKNNPVREIIHGSRLIRSIGKIFIDKHFCDINNLAYFSAFCVQCYIILFTSCLQKSNNLIL